MSGYTKGPWRVEPSHDINGELFAIGTNYQWPEGSDAFVGIAFTAHIGIGPYAQHREADARLIAAAPDYHEAAEAMIARHDAAAKLANFDKCGCADCAPFRAAIAKAEGRES